MNGRTYASTQPPYVDPKTGKKKYRYVHWGRVDENMKFLPGTSFYQATPEERAKLNFPGNWDMSDANKFTGLRTAGRPVCDHNCENRFYGDIWLLEQIAEKTGIRQDLEKVFNGNIEIVDDILTLAMFPYLTKYSYNRVVRWQRIAKAPSSRELTPKAITLLTQYITEQHRMDLLKFRGSRLGKDELCAVDTTSRSAYGDSLTDIRWGKNKEGLPLEQTNEVVVYTLSNHMPVYYRTFPGNMPDCRSLDTILTELKHAGFKNLVLLTDRGFETLGNLEQFILRGQSMIMCAKTSQKEVAKIIENLNGFEFRPKEMEVDTERRIYHSQYEIDYTVKSTGTAEKAANKLKVNLYFDPNRRSNECVQLDIDLAEQGEELRKLYENKSVIDDKVKLKKEYRYYTVKIDKVTREILSFEQNVKNIEKHKKHSGFFSIITHGVDFDSKKTLNTYRLRDEQEKYFQQMKSQMVSDRQKNWSEEGKTGRLLILFVGLILGSHVRHIWNSTDLKSNFSSSLEILDEMRSIRCIEHTNRAKFITPFVGAQVDICQAFGLEIPKGCTPVYKSCQKRKSKRGRPTKKNQSKGL
jgi:hypothetical protein